MKSSYIKRVAHITIGVSDLKKSVSLFEEVCGKFCQSYRELLEEHLRKHRREQVSSKQKSKADAK